MTFFQTEYSIPSSKALLELVKQNYNIEGLCSCKFWKSGSNTTYMIETITEKYILRVYHYGKWVLDEILYEVNLLLFLKKAGMSVSAPVYMNNGELVTKISAPEGERFVVMFEYANGKRMRTNEVISTKLGEAAAHLHLITKAFNTNYTRPKINIYNLIDIPTKALLQELKHNEIFTEKIILASEKVKSKLAKIESELEQGVCHGDLFSGNCHIDENEEITLFDFDECSPGYIAYDLAVYYWSMKREGQPKIMWEEFLKAYKQVKGLSEKDEEAIALLVIGRQLWFMAQVIVFRANILGHSISSDLFISQQIDFLDSLTE